MGSQYFSNVDIIIIINFDSLEVSFLLRLWLSLIWLRSVDRRPAIGSSLNLSPEPCDGALDDLSPEAGIVIVAWDPEVIANISKDQETESQVLWSLLCGRGQWGRDAHNHAPYPSEIERLESPASLETASYVGFVLKMRKYFRIRLSDKVSTERSETDLPETDLREKDEYCEL